MVPDEVGEQAADLGHGEWDQVLDGVGSPLFPPASAVVTVRKAWASMARVMCRYPTDLAYYLCHGPERTPQRELVRVAGARWAIEETFQTAKGQVGLDRYQVPRYRARRPRDRRPP